MTTTQTTRPWEIDNNALAIGDGFMMWDAGDWRLTVADLSDDDTERWGWQIIGPDEMADEDESGPDYQTWQEAAEAGWQEIGDRQRSPRIR